MTLTPALGLDYKNKKDAEADFRAGKDFQMHSATRGFGLCSIRDFKPGEIITIRYAKLTKAFEVTV